MIFVTSPQLIPFLGLLLGLLFFYRLINEATKQFHYIHQFKFYYDFLLESNTICNHNNISITIPHVETVETDTKDES